MIGERRITYPPIMSEMVIRSARPEPMLTYLSPLAPIRTIVVHRELIWNFAARELLERHKGAILGVAWNIINPLLTLAIYTMVFGYIFGTRWDRGGGSIPARLDFPLVFLTGHTLFHVFGECANRAPTMVSGRSNLVRKVVFPIEVLPVTAVVSSLVYAMIALAIVALTLLISTGGVPASAVCLPVLCVPLVMLALGASWFLSAVGVFVRDMRHIVQVLTQLLMFMTPIFYKVDRLPEDARWIGVIVNANPLSVIVENGRRALLWNEPLEWGKLAMVTVFAVIVMQAGYAFFMATRRGMADVH